MSDKKDDVKKLPQFEEYVRKKLESIPKQEAMHKQFVNFITPYNNAVFHSAHLAQMVDTNTVSNPRPKAQQDWMTKQGAKIKQARENYAGKDVGFNLYGEVTGLEDTKPKRKKQKLIESRKEIADKTVGHQSKYNPTKEHDKEVIDRVTGSVKGGKPISDPEQKVIRLGMKKDDKK